MPLALAYVNEASQDWIFADAALKLSMRRTAALPIYEQKLAWIQHSSALGANKAFRVILLRLEFNTLFLAGISAFRTNRIGIIEAPFMKSGLILIHKLFVL